MTSRIRIFPYRQGSKGAKALSLELGGKVLRLEGSKYKPKQEDVIINWGNTTFNESAEWGPKTPETFFNYDTDCMRLSTNKLMFFKFMGVEHSDIIPQFWDHRNEIPEDAYPVVCRTVLAGHSGDGIVIASGPDSLVDCSLYTKYIKKKEEYRVHVGRKDGTSIIISLQRKAKRNGFENPNWQVRNHANGFVFVRHEVNPPESVLHVAKQALERSGLDFGAVDVIWNEHEQKAYVLEINTAPGLEGTTIKDYGDYFRSIING